MVKLPLEKYEYILAIGTIGALGFGYGTGANDVANAFGTSVGSGALTNRQACFLAACFEFFGALVLGRVSTSTIAGGIADRNIFKTNPAAYAYGMMWTLIVGTLWLLWSTSYGLNVSSTHSIIGGIIGFALSYSRKGVLWLVDDPLSIPPYKGIVPIVVAWFFAPIATGTASSMLFIAVRTLVLRDSNSFSRALYLLPFFVLFTCWINIYFVFTKGAKKSFTENKDDWDDNKSAWVAMVIAIGLAFCSIVLIPFVKKKAELMFEQDAISASGAAAKLDATAKQSEEGNPTNDGDDTDGRMTGIEYIMRHRSEISLRNIGKELSKANLASINADHKFMHEDLNEKVTEIHEKAEKFDKRTESVFKVLQIFSACCVMFAHGAGEVGYMAGPLTTINEFYNTGKIPKTVKAPMWVLVISALSLVIGLATYGQRVTRAMGKEISTITATRGFCAEISTAIVIMVAAQYGLPTSSSQCITGGIVGIGIAEGIGGVNWKRFLEIFASWIATLFVVGLGTASLYAQGLAAPKRFPAKGEI